MADAELNAKRHPVNSENSGFMKMNLDEAKELILETAEGLALEMPEDKTIPVGYPGRKGYKMFSFAQILNSIEQVKLPYSAELLHKAFIELVSEKKILPYKPDIKPVITKTQLLKGSQSNIDLDSDFLDLYTFPGSGESEIIH